VTHIHKLENNILALHFFLQDCGTVSRATRVRSSRLKLPLWEKLIGFIRRGSDHIRQRCAV